MYYKKVHRLLQDKKMESDSTYKTIQATLMQRSKSNLSVQSQWNYIRATEWDYVAIKCQIDQSCFKNLTLHLPSLYPHSFHEKIKKYNYSEPSNCSAPVPTLYLLVWQSDRMPLTHNLQATTATGQAALITLTMN